MECPRCHQQVPQVELLQCRGCRGYTHQLQPDGRCLDCHLGLVHCPTHSRLEHAGSDHRKVTAAEVISIFRKREQQQQTSNVIVGPWGGSASR
jgi:hypothetical protein